MKYTRLFWTGSVDELFEYKFGELPYRSVYLDFQKHNSQEFQKLAVINYPCNYDFTRICEYKWFLNEQSDKIIISYEYPQKFKLGKNDRCYPIVSQDNNNLYDKYLDEVKKLKNVYCLGRLGDYKYYDMDKAVLRALELYGEILK
jgi:UDP-galactopyranose mutase